MTNWVLHYESDLVQIMEGVGDNPHFRVKNKTTGEQTYFRGETDWSDAQRFASDIDFGAVVNF